MKNLVSIFFFLSLTLSLSAQNINQNFERWQIDDRPVGITGIDLASDGKTLAIVCSRRQPLFIYDLETKSIQKEIDVKSEFMGYNVYFSSNDNYLLLQEKVIETTYKRAKQGSYVVVDLAKGEVIHRFNKISDAKISADEKYVVTLDKGTISFIDIKSGNTVKKFDAEDACNALALSPDGKDVAVVKKPTKQDVKMLVSKNVSKKAIKAAAKYKHLVTVYDTESLELKNLIPDFYDNINLLFYTDDGEKLLSFNVAANSYVNVALPGENYKPVRESYLSRTTIQPEFSYSNNKKYFGIATVENAPSINIYDVESGSIVDYYNAKMKIWKNMKKDIFAGPNTSFVFLPGDKYVLIGYGNSLIKWKFKTTQ